MGAARDVSTPGEKVSGLVGRSAEIRTRGSRLMLASPIASKDDLRTWLLGIEAHGCANVLLAQGPCRQLKEILTHGTPGGAIRAISVSSTRRDPSAKRPKIMSSSIRLMTSTCSFGRVGDVVSSRFCLRLVDCTRVGIRHQSRRSSDTPCRGRDIRSEISPPLTAIDAFSPISASCPAVSSFA